MSPRDKRLAGFSALISIPVDGARDIERSPWCSWRKASIITPRCRAEAAGETARQILGAFSDSMRSQWFDEITLEEVAEKAGVNVRTVIRRFGGKEGLLEAFVDDFIPSIAVDRATPPGDIAAAIDRLTDIYETWGDSVIRNLAQESRHPALKRLLDLGRERHRAITAATYASWLDRILPSDRARTLDALVAASDVYIWKLARRDMGRSRAEAARILHTLIDAPLNFLFATAHLGGNVSPVMPVVRQLVAAGHSVRVMSDNANRADAESVGARFRSWNRAPNRADRARADDPPDWNVSDREGIGMVAQFLAGTALAYAQDTIEELRQEPADLLVCFDMLLGPMLGAEAIGQKLALLGTMISFFPLPGIAPLGSGLGIARTAEEKAVQDAARTDMTTIFDSALPGLNAARSTLGLPPLDHLADQCAAASVHWIGTAQAFDFEQAILRPNMRYTGPLLGDPAWAEPWHSPRNNDDNRPLVLVGFSTSFQNHAGVLQRVIDAASSLPVRLLVTLGGSIERHELVPADNTVVVRSAPHLEILKDASLVVTHGGHGTVMAALVHRVPMLVVPHGRDQADNAARIAERGAGLAVARTAPTEEIRAALVRLISEPGFRAAARTLGDAVDAELRSSTLIADLEALAENRSTSRSDPASYQEGFVA
eukprot:gene18145-18390_t